LTGQGKFQNRKIISERKQSFYRNSLPVRQTDKESIFVGLDIFLSANPTKPPLSFSPNAKPGVKRKQENVVTKADKRKYEDKRDRCFQEH
jgi:hypothetical protein